MGVDASGNGQSAIGKGHLPINHRHYPLPMCLPLPIAD
jgi:hypothetical protein